MTDEELIEGILNKNQATFKILVDKYQFLVLNTCNSFLHNKTFSEDVTQEVFIEVFLSIHKFKKEAKLSTWLYRISVNKSLNFIRDNKKNNLFKSIENFFLGEGNQELQISDNEHETSENEAIQKERIELLHKSINALSKNQKVAFTLHKIENLSYKQISEVMNLSLSSVEGLIHRAKINVQRGILSFYKKK
ncbi:RNA polymerase sigma factor [Lutibacter sp.]|uniref:RNA polymerase sigma factor n=1 Tax=Lutibacter sp. TaxID=1925666 RepID=UPI003566F6D3